MSGLIAVGGGVAEDKLRIVAETKQPGASFAAAARRHEINRGLLWHWRQQVRRGALAPAPMPVSVPVRITPDPAVSGPVLQVQQALQRDPHAGDLYVFQTRRPAEDPAARRGRMPVLAKGKTSTGRLWTYVRDDRPFAGPAPPAAVFHYAPDRRGEHPQRHLASYAGFLQADAYAGFGELYHPGRKPGPIDEAGCWAHGRRKLFDLAQLANAPARPTK